MRRNPNIYTGPEVEVLMLVIVHEYSVVEVDMEGGLDMAWLKALGLRCDANRIIPLGHGKSTTTTRYIST